MGYQVQYLVLYGRNPKGQGGGAHATAVKAGPLFSGAPRLRRRKKVPPNEESHDLLSPSSRAYHFFDTMVDAHRVRDEGGFTL